MITTATFITIVMALLSFMTAGPITNPINNPEVVMYVPKDDKPLPQPEMERLIGNIEMRFVQLMSNDGKVRQGWGLLYDDGIGIVSGLLVRSLDVYRFGKSYVDLSAISGNKSMVVMKPDRWQYELQSRSGVTIGVPSDFEMPYEGSSWGLQTIDSLTINYQNDFQIPYDGHVSGTLVYPARDGKVHTSRTTFSVSNPEVGKPIFLQFSYNPPENYDSGIAVIVRADGKLLPIALDADDKTKFLPLDVNNYNPSTITIDALRGNTKRVEPLSNQNKIFIEVSSKDELEPISDTAVKSYVSLFLNEECPRLAISPTRFRPGDDIRTVTEPKSSTEKEALSQLFGGYEANHVSVLIVTYHRSPGGLFVVELNLYDTVLGNGGSTGAYLYRDYIYGVNIEKTDIVRDHIKALVKRFSDQWILANPRQPD